MIHKVLFDSLGVNRRLDHWAGRIFSRRICQYHHQQLAGKTFTRCQTQSSWQTHIASSFSKSGTLHDQPLQLLCRNFSSRLPPLDPKQAVRKKRLTFATYLSGIIGAILLSAIGLRYYNRVKRKAAGAEEVKVKEYSFGRRAWMYKYRGYVFSDLFLERLRDIHTFDIREDDVWVVTFPKSGTTWVQEIVYLLMNDMDFEKASEMNIDLRFPYFEFLEPGLQTIAQMPSPRLIKSHLPFSLLPNQMKNKKPKIIYIVRNPKDIIFSYYSFTIKFLKMVPFNGSFEDYSRLFAADKVPYGPWWKHVSEAWSKKDEDNILLLFYEDLKMDSHKCVKEMAEFLGKHVSDEQVDMIVKHCSFENMRQNNSVNYEWFKDYGVANKGVQFMRKGEVGDWKNHLSADIVKDIDEMVATKLPPDMVGYIKDSLPEN